MIFVLHAAVCRLLQVLAVRLAAVVWRASFDLIEPGVIGVRLHPHTHY